MSDHDRGAYTPQTDAPLAFDARQSRGGGAGGRSPMALIISGFVLAILIGAVFVFYQGGVRGKDQPPQPVGQPVGEMKTIAPPQPKEPNATASLDVYKSGETPPAAPAFAPAPEQPLPRPAARPTIRVERSDIPPVGGPPMSTGVRVEPMPAAPKAAPKSIDQVLAQNSATAPQAMLPRPTAPKPAAAGGVAAVQIGAFSSEALAAKGWSDVAAAFPADMGGKGRRTEAVPGSALHRSLITGFASREAAAAFCGKLKAAGKSCLVK